MDDDANSLLEVQAGAALYAHLLRALIDRLVEGGVIGRSDLDYLAEKVATFGSIEEPLPPVVEGHAGLLVELLADFRERCRRT